MGLRYDLPVKRKLLLATVGFFVIIVGGASSWYGIQLHQLHLRKAACKQRGDALDARVEMLKKRAQEKLHIGTSKDAALRFFAENAFPAKFDGNEIEGTVSADGCSPVGCGTNAALIGMRVSVDESGTVVSEPVVVALYTDCL
jgi:hypothetical protein